MSGADELAAFRAKVRAWWAFGGPIGRFQALQFKLADLTVRAHGTVRMGSRASSGWKPYAGAPRRLIQAAEAAGMRPFGIPNCDRDAVGAPTRPGYTPAEAPSTDAAFTGSGL